MAITELTNSRTISYNSGSPVGVREYYAYPYATEKLVLDEIAASNIPNKLDPWPSSGFFTPAVGLYVHDFAIRHDPNVPEGWFVTITYREWVDATITPTLLPNDAGYITMRLSMEAQFEDAWRQWPSSDDLEQQAGTNKLDDFQRPLFAVGTLNSDIGGTKIDVAGAGVSVMTFKQRMQLEVSSNIRPQPNTYRQFLGTRNLTPFIGCARGTAVFVGAEAVMPTPGKWQITFGFDVDYYFHLKQIPKRHPNGSVVLEPVAEGSEGVGNARIVSWVQPFPIGTEFRNIIPYFTGL